MTLSSVFWILFVLLLSRNLHRNIYLIYFIGIYGDEIKTGEGWIVLFRGEFTIVAGCSSEEQARRIGINFG